MNAAATVISTLGAITIFIGALVATTRAIFKQVHTVENNTAAVRSLTAKLEEANTTVISHEHRITILESRVP